MKNKTMLIFLTIFVNLISFNSCSDNSSVEKSPPSVEKEIKVHATPTDIISPTPTKALEPIDKNRLIRDNLSFVDPETGKKVYLGMSRSEVDKIFSDSDKVNKGINTSIYHGLQVCFDNNKVVYMEYANRENDMNREFVFANSFKFNTTKDEVTKVLGDSLGIGYIGENYSYEEKNGNFNKLSKILKPDEIKSKKIICFEFEYSNGTNVYNFYVFDLSWLYNKFLPSYSTPKPEKVPNVKFNNKSLKPENLFIYDKLSKKKVFLSMTKSAIDDALGQKGYEKVFREFNYEQLKVTVNDKTLVTELALTNSINSLEFNERYIFFDGIKIGDTDSKVLDKLGNPTVKHIIGEGQKQTYIYGYCYEVIDNRLIKTQSRPAKEDILSSNKTYYFLSLELTKRSFYLGSNKTRLNQLFVFSNKGTRCQNINLYENDWNLFYDPSAAR